MADVFLKVPFAVDGDMDAIPNASQPDGSVSFDIGYGIDYELDPDDPDVRYPERTKMNYLFNVMTTLINQWQTQTYANFITSAMNGGSPWPYGLNTYVRFDDGIAPDVYYSLVVANTSDPTDATKWARVAKSSVPTGVLWEYQGASLPSGGWVWPDGGTVGNASSNATNRANPDTLNIFTQIWTDYPNSVRPIIDSSGSPTTRGFTAAADYAANKALPVVDKRGRSGIGRDNMGGTAANRITSSGSGIDGTVLGLSGGAQNVSLTSSQNGLHNHSVGTLATASGSGTHNHTGSLQSGPGTTSPGLPVVSEVVANGSVVGYGISGPHVSAVGAAGNVVVNIPTGGAHDHTLSGATADSGAGDAHQNVQPGIVMNFILKL